MVLFQMAIQSGLSLRMAIGASQVMEEFRFPNSSNPTCEFWQTIKNSKGHQHCILRKTNVNKLF